MSARTILKHLYKEGRMTTYQYERIDRCLKERQGEWIDGDCSVCGCSCKCDGWGNDIETKFCPNCGADMRERR